MAEMSVCNQLPFHRKMKKREGWAGVQVTLSLHLFHNPLKMRMHIILYIHAD